MKLKFKKQEFQDNAVMSVVDLFKGCASAPSTFSVEKMDIVDLSQDELLGYANKANVVLHDRSEENVVSAVASDSYISSVTSYNEKTFYKFIRFP